MCLLPPRPVSGTAADEVPTFGVVGAAAGVDMEWLLARLAWTNTRPPIGRQPTAAEWREWWRQCRLVPPAAWSELDRVDRTTRTTCGQPLTDLARYAHLRGQVVGKYTDGRPFTYDDLPGFGDPAFRIDHLKRSGAYELVPHEVGHPLEAVVLGGASRSARFDALWRRHAPATGDPYLIAYRDEAWAEWFGYWAAFRHRPGAFPLPIDVWHYYNHTLVVERGWADWPVGA